MQMEPPATNAFSPNPTPDEIARATNAFTTPGGAPPSGGMNIAPAMPQGYFTGQPNAMMTRSQPLMPASAGMQIAQMSYQPALSARMEMVMPAAQPVWPAQLQEMYSSLHALRESVYPSQREWAAETLCTLDWKNNPTIVDALVSGAREDPAATVRATCVRSLAKMKVRSPDVVSAITGLKDDADPRVRQEAEQALTMLGPATQPAYFQPIGETLMPGNK
jgi:hypothetical protein